MPLLLGQWRREAEWDGQLALLVKRFPGAGWSWGLHHSENVLGAIELYTEKWLKWPLLCRVCFTTIINERFPSSLRVLPWLICFLGLVTGLSSCSPGQSALGPRLCGDLEVNCPPEEVWVAGSTGFLGCAGAIMIWAVAILMENFFLSP